MKNKNLLIQKKKWLNENDIKYYVNKVFKILQNATCNKLTYFTAVIEQSEAQIMKEL